MREKLLASDADQLPGLWAIIDTTKRPDYDGGKQMYPDTERFKDLMASLRDAGKIKVPSEYRHVPRPSRFALSPDEIDGKDGFVSKAIADIIGLEEGEEITTLLASTFNYVGNLHPELGFGDANTSEWFRNNFEHGCHLFGGSRVRGGLGVVFDWQSDYLDDDIVFRLQFSFPAKA